MSKKLSPTKNTGGGGFDFEDKVAAHFMTCLLASRPPLDPVFGTIKRIDFQVMADGWFLDDLLLTLKGSGKERRCAFSIKSNTQFSEKTAPSDFVKDTWKQFLRLENTAFNPETDRLGIITSPLDTNTKTSLESILKKAREQDPKDLQKRIKEKGYVSDKTRRLFNSFNCPQSIADKSDIDVKNTGILLRCIEHLQFDFEHTSSSRSAEAVSILRDILDSGTLEEANNLWQTLCFIARETRTQGGHICLSSLIGKLRTRFKLSDFPDYSKFWESIRKKTKDELGLISEKIADEIVIDRSEVVADVVMKLNENKIIVLLGESGSGKTVLGKTIAENYFGSHNVLWINSENLAFVDDLQDWETFKIITDNKALIVIDGLDRFYDISQLKKIALILQNTHQFIENSPWEIIISCQPEEWGRLQSDLSKINITSNWITYDLNNPSDKDLKSVWQKFPKLRSLSHHLHLRKFLFNPKVLDLFASRIKAGREFNVDNNVGESSLINWYWEQEIEAQAEGLIRGNILKHLAEKLADDLITELPSTEFSPDEIREVQNLVRNRILKKRGDRISFEHDLIADWTRQRIILEKYPNIHEYIKDKLTSPMWCKALRLVGIHFLESDEDIRKWKNLFDSFGRNEKAGNLGQDLLLEASIFSGNPLSNLEKVWDELYKNNGVLLGRFLNRFLYSATFPNDIALTFAGQYGDEANSEILALYRDPYWVYWIPVIEFLYKHKDDVAKLTKKQILQITDKWLRYSKKDWPLRNEAAEIAIEIAEELLAIKLSNVTYYGDSDFDKLALKSGLAACHEQPDRVIVFALTACSRRNPSGRILKLIEKYNEEDSARKKEFSRPSPNIPVPLTILPFEDETPPPWPDGPIDIVDSDFQEICLEEDALYPLISEHPDKASEIILALLLEHPTPKDSYSSPFEQYTGLTFVHKWFPPFYTRGPFYYFLNEHPEEGLDLIISLINFATDRWAEHWTKRDKESPHIEIEFPWGIKKYIGDAYVYYWHRDVGNVSHIIPSALMALEKWFYDCLEKEEFREIANKHIEKILKSSTSLSFIGLLITIGKKKLELFNGRLLPLLSVPEFYSWDVQHGFKSESHQMIGWNSHGMGMTKLAKEFNQMPHRKYQFDKISISLFLNEEKASMKFEEFRDGWKYRFENSLFNAVSPDMLENLIQWFDKSNWKIKEDPEHGRTFEFEMPKEIIEKREEGVKEIEDRQLLIHLPLKFRRILDGQEELSLDDAEKVWNTIQKISEIQLAEDDPEIDELYKENAICGGIAVLYKCFKNWLREQPDKESWCIDKITGIILDPPQDKSFDSEVSIANWHWDRFCAEVMPMIWAEIPGFPLYRRCIAALACNKHYETVGILFRSTFELRSSLKNDFNQLINFLLKLSHAKWKFYRGRYSVNNTFDINQWIENEVKIFEKRMESNKVLKWEDIATDEIKRRKKLYEKEAKKRGGTWTPPKDEYFDLWLMKAAFNYLPPLNQAIDKVEREEWLKFYRQALSWTLNIFKTDDRGELSGVPSEWDRWLFNQIAIQIIHMHDIERPEEFWKPILNLAAEGHYWVDVFLMEWFIIGIGYEVVSDSFIERWKEMVEYAFISEKWSLSKQRFWFYRNKLWCNLLGMGNTIPMLWDERKQSLINEMKQYYEKWAKIFLSEPESAYNFIYFLMQPAAEKILFDGLIWIDIASEKAGENFFNDRHYNIQKPLANLLEVSWKKHKDKINGHRSTNKAFKSLLRKLVDMQNPQAIVIQQHLHL